MKSKLLLLFSLILLCGCVHTNQSVNKLRSQHRGSHRRANKDTLYIGGRTAVRVTLDSIGLEKNKQKYGDTSVDAYIEDGAYYDYIADSVLKRKNLPIIEATNYKFLKFIQKNGTTTIIKIDTLPEISTLFFFDPSKKPRIADVVDIENDYKNYFR